MARKLPDPAERSEKEPAVLCSSTRVLALYNNNHKNEALRVSKEVRSWFTATAKKEGWSAAMFLKDVETKHSAGCMLYKAAENILINVFIPADDDEG